MDTPALLDTPPNAITSLGVRRGGEVFWRVGNAYRRSTLVEEYKHYPALKVRYSGEEYTVSPQEVLTPSENLARRVAIFAGKHEKIIAAWKAGETKRKAIAEALSIPYSRVLRVIRAALMYKVIETPTKPASP